MRNLTIVMLLMFLLASCKVQQDSVIEKRSIPTTGLIHTVYFWFSDDTSAEQLKAFEQGLIALGKVPSISKYYWGPPAETKLREVVDNTYDYAINVFFESVDAQEAYQIDPMHLKFVEKYGELFEKVIVYDNAY